MYFLLSINNDKAYYLLGQNEFIIGRKNCDILLENDSSISRHHAKICIRDANEVTLKDFNSKYKTFINGNQIDPNVKIQLSERDKIQFGGLNTIFIFKKLNLVTTATQLSTAQKESLKKQLNFLQGKYVNDWNIDCTHLTLEKISLTVKVLHALLEDKPIVVPEYWSVFAKNVTENLPPPKVTDYNNLPLAEALLNKTSFINTVSRKGLFKGKTFVFVLEQEKKQVESLIKKAGGYSISWEKNPPTLQEITQSSQEFIIVQSSKDVNYKSYEEVLKHISQLNKRTIPMTEIAMAIIHGSCEKDCNPNFNRGRAVFVTSKQKETTQHQLLVHNTESQTFSNNQDNKVIPETELPVRMDEVPSINKEKNDTEVKVEENEKEIEIIKSKNSTNERESIKRTIEVDDQNPSKKMKLQEVEKRMRPLQSENQYPVELNHKNQSKSQQSQKRKTLNDSDEEDVANNKFYKIFSKRCRPNKNVSQANTSKNRPENVSINTGHPFEDNSYLFSSTRKETKSRDETLYNSKKENHTWSSKNTSRVRVKLENEETDPELQKFIQLFQDKFIVEVLSNLSIRSSKSVDEIDCSNNSSVKNFKKFKKIKPLHPQTRIIGKDTFTISACGDTSGINDTRRTTTRDSDEEMPPPSTIRKRGGKRFAL